MLSPLNIGGKGSLKLAKQECSILADIG